METSKTNKGCQSQKDYDSQSAGIETNTKDLTVEGKALFTSLHPLCLKIECNRSFRKLTIQLEDV
mgnify:CR=1 FL=1